MARTRKHKRTVAAQSRTTKRKKTCSNRSQGVSYMRATFKPRAGGVETGEGGSRACRFFNHRNVGAEREAAKNSTNSGPFEEPTATGKVTRFTRVCGHRETAQKGGGGIRSAGNTARRNQDFYPLGQQGDLQHRKGAEKRRRQFLQRSA